MKAEELKQIFEEAGQYVYDLKNHPEKRMKNVRVGDKVFFLRQDQEKEKLWNCGYAEVMGVENRDGVQKGACRTHEVQNLFLKSESYPFSVYVELKHVLVNYTDQDRQAKEESKNE